MEPYRADRVVRFLGAIVSLLYWFSWLALVFSVVGLPLIRAYWPHPELSFNVPVSVEHRSAELSSTWQGRAWPVELVEDTDSELHVPLAAPPTGLFVGVWLSWVVLSVLMLGAMHQLRRVFQRVRAGAPFDPENARHLRSVGLLLLGYAVIDGITGFAQSRSVLATLADGGGLSTPLRIGPLALVALVLIALAEIFRRGAALEDEQSLVV